MVPEDNPGSSKARLHGGRNPEEYGTHSVRYTKATQVYRRTNYLRAVQLMRESTISPGFFVISISYGGELVSEGYTTEFCLADLNEDKCLSFHAILLPACDLLGDSDNGYWRPLRRLTRYRPFSLLDE